MAISADQPSGPRRARTVQTVRQSALKAPASSVMSASNSAPLALVANTKALRRSRNGSRRIATASSPANSWLPS